MKIGIFGGSFDPIHIGHAVLAANIAGGGLVDEVWLTVSPQNPLKDQQPVASDADRMTMARLAADKCEGVRVSDIEHHLSPPFYTYRTLCELKKKHPEHDFILIIGSDNWKIFNKWRDYDKIISDFGVIIYQRPGYEADETELPENVVLLKDTPLVLLSSTTIRNYLANNRRVDFLLPSGVEEYIRHRGLYEAK